MELPNKENDHHDGNDIVQYGSILNELTERRNRMIPEEQRSQNELNSIPTKLPTTLNLATYDFEKEKESIECFKNLKFNLFDYLKDVDNIKKYKELESLSNLEGGNEYEITQRKNSYILPTVEREDNTELPNLEISLFNFKDEQSNRTIRNLFESMYNSLSKKNQRPTQSGVLRINPQLVNDMQRRHDKIKQETELKIKQESEKQRLIESQKAKAKENLSKEIKKEEKDVKPPTPVIKSINIEGSDKAKNTSVKDESEKEEKKKKKSKKRKRNEEDGTEERKKKKKKKDKKEKKKSKKKKKDTNEK